MKGLAVLIAIAVLAAVFLGGVLLYDALNGEAGEPAITPPLSNATPPATNSTPVPRDGGTTQTGPLAGDDLAKAQSLFKVNCATCHLENGVGSPHHKKDGIPDFTSAVWFANKTQAEMISSIRNGKGTLMPAFANRFSDDEIRLLVHYVREFPTRVAARPESKGDRTSAGKPKSDHQEHGGHH